MNCDECEKAGNQSTVKIIRTMPSWLRYTVVYDENENAVSREPSAKAIDYRCSNGHTWSELV